MRLVATEQRAAGNIGACGDAVVCEWEVEGCSYQAEGGRWSGGLVPGRGVVGGWRTNPPPSLGL